MEPDEKHEPQYDDQSDRLIEYEAEHYDTLVEKFLNRKAIRSLWEDFVYQEYMDNPPEPPDYGGDR